MKTGDEHIADVGGGDPSLPAMPAAQLRLSWWDRSGWLIVLGVTVAAFFAVLPIDAAIAGRASSWGGGGGDLRRELHAWQQFGQGVFVAVVALVIWQLDPVRRRRLLDLALIAGLAKLVAQAMKMGIGRPRPRPEFADPQTFIGPTGMYPIRAGTDAAGESQWKLVHAWDTAAGASTDLWSMPSSHTLFAFAVAAYLGRVYPRLAVVVYPLAAVVGVGRVVFDAHWPTDVVVGAGVGYVIGTLATSRYWGVRLLDWVWVRFVNRGAKPALPELLAREALGR